MAPVNEGTGAYNAPAVKQEVEEDWGRPMTNPLILKTASASRPSGEWSDDDYDVLCGGDVVGRIMKAKERS